MSFASLDRYRSIIEDWDGFQQALLRELPRCGWTNLLKITPEQLFERFENSGVEFTRLPWDDAAFTLQGAAASSPGNLLEHYLGYFQIQEEAALIPARLVRGESVLDMCAAPGNKTAQIAVALRNKGTVVANDRSYPRMRAIRNTLDRLGLVNVVMTQYDAANFPARMQFDTVLADVPCTCEGTSRKNPTALEPEDPDRLERLLRSQRAILRKAFRLCKPGGRVIYSTCTYAPEENESVVDDVVASLPFEPGWVDCRVDGFSSVPGLLHWEGRAYSENMTKTIRVWPHLNDSGGFFVAAWDKPELW